MVQAILTLKENNIKTCTITNNWHSTEEPPMIFPPEFLERARPVDQSNKMLIGISPKPWEFSKVNSTIDSDNYDQ